MKAFGIWLAVVAVVFGGRLVLHGLVVAWAAWRDRDPGREPAAAPARHVGRAWRLTGSIVALVLAVALAGLSVWLNSDRAVVDAFYTPPPEVPAAPAPTIPIRPTNGSCCLPSTTDRKTPKRCRRCSMRWIATRRRRFSS